MVLQDYQESWSADFQRIARTLAPALAGLAVVIEHVGSTAVPGLAAKPILDIDLVYSPDVALLAITAALASLGYCHVGNQGIPGREVFKRPGGSTPHHVLDQIPHHLYACPVQGEERWRHVLFRNFLRGNETARQRYQDLKMHLAEKAGQDKRNYATLKQTHARAFVTEALALAPREEDFMECLRTLSGMEEFLMKSLHSATYPQRHKPIAKKKTKPADDLP